MLEALSDGKPHPFADLVESISDSLRLDDDIRERRLASGQAVIYNRLGWTRTNLAKAGLVDNPNARVVALTAAGRSFLASHPGPVDTDTLKRDCPPYLNWLADMGAIPAVERRDRGEPTVWMVRAGEGGVHAPVFVQRGAALLGWGEGRRSLRADPRGGPRQSGCYLARVQSAHSLARSPTVCTSSRTTCSRATSWSHRNPRAGPCCSARFRATTTTSPLPPSRTTPRPGRSPGAPASAAMSCPTEPRTVLARSSPSASRHTLRSSFASSRPTRPMRR